MSDLTGEMTFEEALRMHETSFIQGVKAERERIAKWAEKMADEYGKLDLFDVLDQVEEPHIVIKGEQK